MPSPSVGRPFASETLCSLTQDLAAKCIGKPRSVSGLEPHIGEKREQTPGIARVSAGRFGRP